MSSAHVSQVRALYKGLLRLHRGLPLNLKAMGDSYVKDEFRRHKSVPKQEADIFMKEWTKYYVTLAKQLSARKKKQTIGMNLSPELIDCFTDEQVVQLTELLTVTTTVKEEPDSAGSSWPETCNLDLLIK